MWNALVQSWNHLAEIDKEEWRNAAGHLVSSLVLLLTSADGGELLYL
jgi:hypothetical protein